MINKSIIFAMLLLVLYSFVFFLKPIRTLQDLSQINVNKAQQYFPRLLPTLPIHRNLELLGIYRDNAVHFYNEKDFSVLLYALAQTSIKNFRDLLEMAFNVRLEDEINWQLLPLGIRPPIDVVQYISRKTGATPSNAVRQFIAELASAKEEVTQANEDTGRLLTVFNVRLESVKKIGDADVRIGIQKIDGNSAPLTIIKNQDPNITHPLRQMDVIASIGTLHGQRFTGHTLQAIAYKYKFRDQKQYCWRAIEGVLTRYSHDVITFIKGLKVQDISTALVDYRAFLLSRSKKAKST